MAPIDNGCTTFIDPKIRPHFDITYDAYTKEQIQNLLLDLKIILNSRKNMSEYLSQQNEKELADEIRFQNISWHSIMKIAKNISKDFK